MSGRIRRVLVPSLALLASLLAAGHARAGAFVTSSSDATAISHPSGYTGTGGAVTVTVCVDPASDDAELLDLAMPAVIAKWNGLTPVTPNLLFGGDNDIDFAEFDWASVAVHELGHCLGLGHPNLASESGFTGIEQDYTQSTSGLNATFDVNDGLDDVIGSTDDVRGDDVNRHWFRIANNDPFTIEPVTVDTGTYSVSLLDLPVGDLFAANASRDVGAALGVLDSECVMQQGQFNDEAQRDLGHDDVATLRLAMSGIDEAQFTGDDYTVGVVYGGVTTTGCDVIANMGSAASFAFCSFSFVSLGAGPGSNHHRLLGADDSNPARMEFNRGVDWHFVLPQQADLCGAAPAGGCKQAGKAQLSIKDDDDDDKDKIKVKLGALQATDFGEFLDPLTDTAYSVCIYDASADPQPLTESGVAGGQTCSGEPCWSSGNGQYQFRSKSGLLEGVTQIKLKAGADGKASVQAQLAGDLVATPQIALSLPVTVQVLADDGVTTECWEASFATATKNADGQFKAKAAAP